MSVIEIDQVTKDYGHHKGVFNISFDVKEGEVVGFLGPNGSGKTTTIRQLMGFIKPDRGTVSIMGMDCFKEASLVQQQLGYLPGEIALMDDMTGLEFIYFMAKMKKIKNTTRIEELIQFLELDARGKMKRMSKGMKQKIGLVIAFMQDAPVLILDEPTSGLDPLMQNKFVELIQQEKAKGKTILMSSHIFEEVENTCDRVVMIKEGQIISIETMENLKKSRLKHYEMTFVSEEEAIQFMKKYPDSKRQHHTITVVSKEDINHVLQQLTDYHLIDLNIRAQSLEELFLHYYGGHQL